MKFQPVEHCKKCGIIILNSSIKEPNRAYCKYCYKEEEREIWEHKKDIVNAKRRPLRRKKQRTDKCICCGDEFTTAREKQVTCGKIECQRLMKNVKAKMGRRGKCTN